MWCFYFCLDILFEKSISFVCIAADPFYVGVPGETTRRPALVAQSDGHLTGDQEEVAGSSPAGRQYSFVINHETFLSHLLVAGCDIGVCQHLCRNSTFMSKLVF